MGASPGTDAAEGPFVLPVSTPALGGGPCQSGAFLSLGDIFTGQRRSYTSRRTSTLNVP